MIPFSCLQLDLLCQMEALESACWPRTNKNKPLSFGSIPVYGSAADRGGTAHPIPCAISPLGGGF